MENWEFLIQQEGDRTWEVINQSILEIEAGKYRIVAHAKRGNLNVDLQISYQPIENGSSQSHQQKFSRRTNSQGLIMVIPYTKLDPGIWEIRCYGDVMSELLGETWQEQIQLKVINKIKPQDQQNNSPKLLSLSPTSPNAKTQQHLQRLEQLLRQEIEPMLQSSPQNNEDKSNDSNSLKLVSPENAAQGLQLILNRDTFLRNQGDSISIAGQIKIDEAHLANLSASIFRGKLRFELSNPNPKQIVFDFEEALLDETLPLAFCYSVEIPNECEIPLLIGDVILEVESEDNFVEIKRQAFTVTTNFNPTAENVQLLIDYVVTIANSNSNQSHPLNCFSKTQKSSLLNVELPEPTKTAKPLTRSKHSSQIIPPRISRTNNKKVVELPQFPKNSLASKLTLLEDNQSVATQAVLLEDEQDFEGEKTSQTQQETTLLSELSQTGESLCLVDNSFQALKLQERFLARLNSLVTESESLAISIKVDDFNPKS